MGLTKNEQIAIRVLSNQLLRDKLREKSESFRTSLYYQQMIESEDYKNLSADEQQAIETLIDNIGVNKDMQKK